MKSKKLSFLSMYTGMGEGKWGGGLGLLKGDIWSS